MICCSSAFSARQESKSACPVARPDCPEAVVFFRHFRQAIKEDNRAAVADMIRYPLRTNLNGKAVFVRSSKKLLEEYENIFTPQVQQKIIQASDDTVWGNYKGYMVADGVVWWEKSAPSSARDPRTGAIDWRDYPFQIITVNN
jgi:hypothetical protein